METTTPDILMDVLDSAALDDQIPLSPESDMFEALRQYKEGEGVAIAVAPDLMRSPSGWGLILTPQARQDVAAEHNRAVSSMRTPDERQLAIVRAMCDPNQTGRPSFFSEFRSLILNPDRYRAGTLRWWLPLRVSPLKRVAGIFEQWRFDPGRDRFTRDVKERVIVILRIARETS